MISARKECDDLVNLNKDMDKNIKLKIKDIQSNLDYLKEFEGLEYKEIIEQIDILVKDQLEIESLAFFIAAGRSLLCKKMQEGKEKKAEREQKLDNLRKIAFAWIERRRKQEDSYIDKLRKLEIEADKYQKDGDDYCKEIAILDENNPKMEKIYLQKKNKLDEVKKYCANRLQKIREEQEKARSILNQGYHNLAMVEDKIAQIKPTLDEKVKIKEDVELLKETCAERSHQIQNLDDEITEAQSQINIVGEKKKDLLKKIDELQQYRQEHTAIINEKIDSTRAEIEEMKILKATTLEDLAKDEKEFVSNENVRKDLMDKIATQKEVLKQQEMLRSLENENDDSDEEKELEKAIKDKKLILASMKTKRTKPRKGK